MRKGLLAVIAVIVIVWILIMIGVFDAHGQTVQVAQTTNREDRNIIVKGVVAGDWRDWLVIEVHNGKEFGKRGYDPSYTRLVVDYKPMIRKLANGRWEIQFTSELAEKDNGIP